MKNGLLCAVKEVQTTRYKLEAKRHSMVSEIGKWCEELLPDYSESQEAACSGSRKQPCTEIRAFVGSGEEPVHIVYWG